MDQRLGRRIRRVCGGQSRASVFGLSPTPPVLERRFQNPPPLPLPRIDEQAATDRSTSECVCNPLAPLGLKLGTGGSRPRDVLPGPGCGALLERAVLGGITMIK